MAGWEATVVWSLTPELVTWRLRAPGRGGEVRYLKVARAGREVPLAAERDRLRWAAGRLPVPPVLAYGADGEHEWLLTAALAGRSAVDAAWLADPPRLVPLLAEGLRRFHAVTAEGCPFDGRLDVALRTVERRLAAGREDAGRALVAHGGITARAALARLGRRRPEPEDLVVCHGDYCLPNVLLARGRVSGYVDLGALGVADRWRDLAVATWSVTRNLGPGWEGRFLAAYGVRRASARLAYYRLLYDLLP